MSASRSSSSVWKRAAISLLSVAVAAVLRAGPLNLLGTRAPFLTFFSAIIVAALYGGMYSGFLATVLSSVSATYWMEPRGQILVIRDPADGVSLAVFAVSGVMISVVCEALHRAREKARAAEASLEIAVERQRADEAIERYELLSRHCRDIILFVRKEDGRVLECNEAAETAYGRTRDELLALTIHDIRMPGDRMLTEWQMDVADASGALFETIHRRKDGTTFPVEVSSTGSTLAGERCMLSVVRDITKRKQADEARREIEANTRAILDAATESIWLFSADGVILSANDTAARRLQSTPAELIGRKFSDLLTPEVSEQRWLQMRKVIASGAPVAYKDERDGIAFDHTFYPIFGDDGKVDRIAVFSRDVTNTLRAQAALVASESRYRDLAESIPAMVWAADAAGATVDHNRRWEEYTGQTAEQARGDGWKDIVHPDDIQRVGEAWETAVRNGKDYAIEYRIRRAADGAYRWHAVHGTARRDEQGKVLGWFGTCIDIEELKMAQEDAAAAHARFHLALSSLTFGALLVNEDGRVAFANQAFCDVFNLKESPDDLRGLSSPVILDLISPAYLNHDDAVSHIQEIVDHGGLVQDEEVPMVGDRTFLRDFIPLQLGGSSSGRLWLHKDITRRKRAESEQSRLAQQRQLALDAARLGWWHYDPETRVATWDDRYKEIFGVTGYESPNDEILNRIHPDDLPKVWAAVEEALDPVNPKPYTAEYRVFNGGDSPCWVEAHGLAIFEGEGECRRAVSFVGTVQDVTESRRLAESLRESEERFRLALRNSPVSVAIQDRNLVYQWAYNQQTRSSDDIVGKTDSDLFSPEDIAAIEGVKRKVLETGSEVHVQTWLTSNGTRLCLDLHYEPMRDDSGEITGIGIAVVNITDQKHLEDALKQSEARLARAVQSLETVMQTAPAAICVAYDVKCEHIFGNARAHEMLGVPTSANLSVTASGGPPPAYTVLRDGKEVAGDDLPMQRAARTGEAWNEEEWEIVRQDGSRINILMSASPLYAEDGGAVGAIGTFLDITERKRAEEALRESEQRLRFHLENSPLAVVEWDAHYLVTQWSWEAERIFGWSAEEVLGKRIDTLNLIYEDDIPIVERTMERLSGGVERTVVSSNRNYTKSRDIIECTWYNSVLLDEEGRMMSVMSLVEDITERKRAEEALRATNEELALFNAAMVGRELRMIELKTEINSLCAGIGHAPRYEVDGEGALP